MEFSLDNSRSGKETLSKRKTRHSEKKHEKDVQARSTCSM